MKNRNLNHSDNWATPPYFYDKLNEEFDFDFDPCPYNTGELEFDGLTIDWGKRNFINPPYSQKLKEDFVKKAIYEAKKGKLCVLLLPVSTSTKLFHSLILPNAKEIRFIEKRIKFIGINSKGEYVNWDYWKHCPPIGVRQKNNSGMHDSMIVILKKTK
jgi:site-specific DNA-methyltransferase (adenine-specific)